MISLHDFKVSFYIQSSFFLFFFFILPAYFFFGETSSNYGVDFYSESESVSFILLSVFIFVLGFISFDVLSWLVPKRVNYLSSVDYDRITIGKFFYIVCVGYLIYLVYQVLTIDLNARYQVKAGERESDLLGFFIYNIMEAIRFSLIMVFLIKGYKKPLIIFLLIVICSVFALSSGRLYLMLNFMLLFCLLFRLKSYSVSLLMFFILALSLPIVLSLKRIIFNLSVNGVFDLSLASFDIDISDYLGNFGHPFFSYLNVDELVDGIGYRYFFDYIQGFLFYLKLIGLDFGLSITYFNTESLIGKKESIIPPGYFAFGYAQLGLFGVFLSGTLYRFIGFLGMILYRELFISQNRVAEVYISFICANSFYYGDVRIFVMNIFFPFLFCFLFCRFFLKKTE